MKRSLSQTTTTGTGMGNILGVIRPKKAPSQKKSSKTKPKAKPKAKKPKKVHNNGVCIDIYSLSEKQLLFLKNKVLLGTEGIPKKIERNGMDPTDPNYDNDYYYCIRSPLSMDQNGRTKNLRLPKYMQQDEGDLEIDPEFQWTPGQILLIADSEFPDSDIMEASHLCDHNFCVNVKHLVWEPRPNNQQRKNCNTWTTCTCGCGHSFNPCKHRPKQCIPMGYCRCPKHFKN